MTLLVLDEGLGGARLAEALEQRGLDATTVRALGLVGAPDEELVAELDARCARPWALVTADLGRATPRAPASAGHRGHAVAWIRVGERASGAALEQATVDVVHRHAHAIAAQRPGQRRVYTATQRRGPS